MENTRTRTSRKPTPKKDSEKDTPKSTTNKVPKKTRTKSTGTTAAKKTTTRSSKSTTAEKSEGASGTRKRTTKPRTTKPRAAVSKKEQPSALALPNVLTEEVAVAGNQLVDKFKEVVAQGNVRRVTIKHDGNTLLELPLTAAIVGGALTVWAAPILAAVAAIAGAVAHVTIEIERTKA